MCFKTFTPFFISILAIIITSCKDDSGNAIALTDINVTPDKLSLVVGEARQIQAQPVPEKANPDEMPFKWESRNSQVASVSSSGMVKALSSGETDIIVSARINKSIHKIIPVTVNTIHVPLTNISVSPESVTIEVDETRQITATPEPKNATGTLFVWNSENEEIATVNSYGIVKGISKGSTFVTVKSGDIEKKIPVSVSQTLKIKIGNHTYSADTLNYEIISEGIQWLKFSLPEFTNGFGTLGKGLVVNTLEVDLSYPGNGIEVTPASQATWGNIERPTAMYKRLHDKYSASGKHPVAVINADFFLLSNSNNTGYAYINNRPLGAEIYNGMVVQTPFSWNNGIIIRDNGLPEISPNVNFSGTVSSGNKSFPLTEVNGYAGAGELVLFNNLANSYPTDSAFAWSPYTSTMVSLSHPKGGWRVNDLMEFTVTGIDYDVETTIPAESPYKGKDFNGQGAILVGNSFGNGTQLLKLANTPYPANDMTVEDKQSYWELKTTDGDPNSYTTPLTSSVGSSIKAEFSFEYQSASDIANMQIFYGTPSAAAGVSTGENLHLTRTGIDPVDENKWKSFTHDLQSAISNHRWGKTGHTLRLDIGNKSGHHVLIRNMKISASFPENDSKIFLNQLNIGDEIRVVMNIQLNGQPIEDKHPNIVGYQEVILQNGNPSNTWNEAHPRTAIGYSKDRKKIYLIVVDGRQNNYSVGATTGQVAEILKALGAYTGVNLDGGGSSCMVVNGEVKNKPSDGSERAVANGIMVTVKN
ncbi:phosphodiester glycosidase family protein [Proteiniphilum sp. X52]|uniref:phosphodiester glycosidase family protein n=1 Tax=Proteiniphilum sp. X52 TaxID=2382159 RepID=UPI000F09EB4D|nr:phosphodiester glycosidase family protein [Proteiniphilum sp. X52]RNC63388.1 hypothetical protein D7D25_16780 [Proteiniphilum sp. X52]